MRLRTRVQFPPSPLVAAGAKVSDFRPAAGVSQGEASRRSHEVTSRCAEFGEQFGGKSPADMARMGLTRLVRERFGKAPVGGRRRTVCSRVADRRGAAARRLRRAVSVRPQANVGPGAGVGLHTIEPWALQVCPDCHRPWDAPLHGRLATSSAFGGDQLQGCPLGSGSDRRQGLGGGVLCCRPDRRQHKDIPAAVEPDNRRDPERAVVAAGRGPSGLINRCPR